MRPVRLYKIHEIFYSIQGEGANTGMPLVFVRFSGCNLNCPFCDTINTGGVDLNANEIYELADGMGKSKRVIFTGGEPLMQLSDEILNKFIDWWIGIETNGTYEIPGGLDWVTVSPKEALHPSITKVNEIRCIIQNNIPLPSGLPSADYYYLSPLFSDMEVKQEDLQWAINLCLENPGWRLSTQNHKYWRIR